MPATDDDGNAKESELPSTLQKSDDKAQRTYAKALDSAEEQYDDEARAHRVAYAALKHTHEKVGDHWEEKDDYGPSDERAKSGGPNPSGEQGRRGRQRLEEAPRGRGEETRRHRPLTHEQGRVGRRDREGEPSADGPESLSHLVGVAPIIRELLPTTRIDDALCSTAASTGDSAPPAPTISPTALTAMASP